MLPEPQIQPIHFGAAVDVVWIAMQMRCLGAALRLHNTG
jgi:hypothetical protein